MGGFRQAAPGSPDVTWREQAFRGYAGHMRRPEFIAAIDEVLDLAAAERTAVMRSESAWWRCRRRLVADFAQVARGVPVRHLMHDGRTVIHQPTPDPAARRWPAGIRRWSGAARIGLIGRLPVNPRPTVGGLVDRDHPCRAMVLKLPGQGSYLALRDPGVRGLSLAPNIAVAAGGNWRGVDGGGLAGHGGLVP